MIRKMKAAGLTLLAVFAVSALAASAAQAAPEFEASNTEGTVSGTGGASEEFVTEAGAVVCSSSSFSGAYATKNATDQLIHPAYSSCKAFGFLSATVNTEDCNYNFMANAKVEAGKYNSEVDVVCPTGDSIKIVASTCSAEVKGVAANEGLDNVTLTNSGGGIKARPAVTGITYNVTNDGFLCPFSGKGEKSDGEYKASADITLTAAGGATISVVGE